MTMVRIVHVDSARTWWKIEMSVACDRARSGDFGAAAGFQAEFADDPPPLFDVVTYYSGPEDSKHDRDNPRVLFTGLRLHDALRSAAHRRAPTAYMGWNWRTVVRAAR